MGAFSFLSNLVFLPSFLTLFFFLAYLLFVAQIKSSIDKQQRKRDDEQKIPQAERDARKEKEGKDLLGLTSASPQEKEQVNSKVKEAGNHFLGLLWSIVKRDIELTLYSVCAQVSHDHGVSPEVRVQRVQVS